MGAVIVVDRWSRVRCSVTCMGWMFCCAVSCFVSLCEVVRYAVVRCIVRCPVVLCVVCCVAVRHVVVQVGTV